MPTGWKQEGPELRGIMSKQNREPRPVRRGPVEQVPIDQLHHGPQPWAARAVSLAEREGVYVHSFMCNVCGLHFNVYSWKADRHRAATTWCPECGTRGRFRHFFKTVNESPTMSLEESRKLEIYDLCEYPRAQLLDDSEAP